jgi:hypothetical protein
MRWSVVSLVGGQSDAGLRDAYDPARGDSRGNVGPRSGDLASAKEALDRVSIPEETLDRIAETISPRPSIIISDEPLSSETGQGTGFVVLLSGEPQGGIKNRRRGPDEARYRRPGGPLIGAQGSPVHTLPGEPDLAASFYDDRDSCNFECDTAAREAERSTEASPGRIRWALVFGE